MREYCTMVRTLEIKAGMADATADEVTNDLTVSLAQAVHAASTGTQTLEGGGWEIVSHNLARVDRHLIVSFLLCRNR